MPAAAGSCFSGLLRCLLCKGSLPTHPSDDRRVGPNVKEEAKYRLKQAYERSASYGVKKPLASSSSHSPGLVARLMGLDELPADHRNPTLGSILRSRSVNSIDFLSHLDRHYNHRRVRTSVSFHEDDYYGVVLKLQEEVVGEDDVFENERRMEERKDKQKKKKKRVLESRAIVAQVVNNGGCIQTSSAGGNGVKCPRESGHGRTRPRRERRNKNPKKEAFTGPSKKSASINLKKIHPEDSVRDAELAKESRARRPSAASETADESKKSRTFVEGKVEKRKTAKTEEKCYYERIVEVICELTEESLDKNWTAMMRGDGGVSKFGDNDEICRQLEGVILEDLLTQIVDEEVVIVFGASN